VYLLPVIKQWALLFLLQMEVEVKGKLKVGNTTDMKWKRCSVF
jgi:hypothetical protein